MWIIGKIRHVEKVDALAIRFSLNIIVYHILATTKPVRTSSFTVDKSRENEGKEQTNAP